LTQDLLEHGDDGHRALQPVEGDHLHAGNIQRSLHHHFQFRYLLHTLYRPIFGQKVHRFDTQPGKLKIKQNICAYFTNTTVNYSRKVLETKKLKN
jgi:hypothetical protein